MTTIEEKNAMKILHYYNEMSTYSKQIQYLNVQFLGVEYINDNPLLIFKLQNGKYFRRQLNNNSCYYEHIPSENEDNIKDESGEKLR